MEVIKESQRENGTNQRPEKEQVKIKSTLSPLRLALKPVPGDGSCLFNALSEGINHVSTGYDPGVLKTMTLVF